MNQVDNALPKEEKYSLLQMYQQRNNSLITMKNHGNVISQKEHENSSKTKLEYTKYSKSPTHIPSSCELSKVQMCIPSAVSETAACPPSPFDDDPSALPSSTSSASSTQYLLHVHSMPAFVC